jgi:hypothetical protein
MKTIGHLKLNGSVFQPRYSPGVERLEKFIDSLADDELVNTNGLRTRGFGSTVISKAQSILLANGKCHPAHQQTFYGNKKAIASLKALLAAPKP